MYVIVVMTSTSSLTRYPLHYALANNSSYDMINDLLLHGCDPNRTADEIDPNRTADEIEGMHWVCLVLFSGILC